MGSPAKVGILRNNGAVTKRNAAWIIDFGAPANRHHGAGLQEPRSPNPGTGIDEIDGPQFGSEEPEQGASPFMKWRRRWPEEKHPG